VALMMTQAGIASGVTAALLIVIFVAICAWAYSSRRRASFESTARLPLEDDLVPGTPPSTSGDPR
jgi:cbb3-type cytochrome oxidase subunit 3